MNDAWRTLPNAHRVLQHADDLRPAWLWSGDGQELIWSNAAAELFQARVKKSGLKRISLAVPIKGQVARTIRLGSPGRSSLARIQFLAGDKPISATCAATPLLWDHDEPVLLIVAVDPVDPEVLAAAAAERGNLEAKENGDQSDADPEFVADREPVDDTDAVLDAAYVRELDSWQDGDAEAAYEPAPPAEAFVGEPDEPDHWAEALGDGPVGAPGLDGTNAEDLPDETPPTADTAEPVKDAAPGNDGGTASRRLSELIDQLAADEALYAPLNEADDLPPETVFTRAMAARMLDPVEVDKPALFRVTGRGFRPLEAEMPENAPEPTAEAEASPPPDAEVVERVSRYNFDELSRILTDRVGERGQQADNRVETPGVPEVAQQAGALINLGGETLVLNRLPLGILVFRDQQVMFANRAITEMVGYDSVENLRQAGLAAIFPVMGPEGQEAGLVNHLVQRDGTLVPVTARLQSISWQGRPALMLSASATEVRTGHEDAVRAFAESFADIRGDGFIEASRSGMVQSASASAVTMLGDGKPLTGRLLSALVGEDDGVALRAFLERPARFAETARPCLTLRSTDGKADILLFALGQAGILSGYFGFVRQRETTPARVSGPADIDPALLARISRGVRRPLNTIIGFSDLMRTQAYGALGDERYGGYAQDIVRAGHEIAALVDELDDYARLRDGRYLPQRASLDLTSLLESCVIRIRDQANGARVIVRNAISESLPRVTADRASLAQAVLNLLASAIDQTPAGGAVIISAQRHDDDAIAILVRDSSAHAVDMAERFVVFRDGVDREGQMLAPIRSSVGLALTRSLLAVNAVSLSVDPAGADGLLFTLRIPADLVDDRPAAEDRE
jgi:signal transduction histidine kinase/PAS domain-containing protein